MYRRVWIRSIRWPYLRLQHTVAQSMKYRGEAGTWAQRDSGCWLSHTIETYSFAAIFFTHFRALGHELFQGPERSTCSASTLLLKRLYFKVPVHSPA